MRASTIRSILLLGFAGILSVSLAACGSNEVSSLRAHVDSLTTVNDDLETTVERLRDSIRAGVERPPGERGTTLEPFVYFPSGSAWLTDRGKRAMDELAQTINQQYDGRAFRIKGYTDNVPIGDSLRRIYPSNWYLSAQRAAAVAHYLNTEHGIQTPTLEIGAYGPQVPVASNETREGRERNRRVEIVVDEPRPDPGF
ncbi:OmpA/MotB family protein [Longibacter sp.]|uniref:OmpA/MotB family protein n=1 Tax=Longibacter sp. TaxID=2045415 RepID=UPI003EC0FFCB